MSRVGVLALVAALACASLAGCRSDPTVAAYLGDGTVTIDEVGTVAADLPAGPAQRGQVAGYVLGSMIIRDVGRRLVARRALTLSQATAADTVAQYYDLPADAPVVSLVTDTQNVLITLAGAVTPVEPDRDQQRAAFEALYFATGRPVSERYQFEQLQYLLNRDSIGRMIALRRVLDEAVAASGITVNPRYAGLTYGLPVEVRLGQGGALARASILVHLTVDEVPAEEA
ncbi:hypothetical protein Daura_47515 [Dactylosporangium aurantiacum]|uniref:Lipoprotein n=1 Tax=Dactylosporangium aurantiacum TaxID=35754 RepID=A0A9Q9IIM5_9ACTN|nr:hypothetical protein [Dactylosporangium aurantiacum]MDG6105409.1 hypothetical protein [Dactylosporangium aurantiacum]UWZ54049.1 hypothetical protein Daura_47515 [Dactylosporangium aurantiacum]